MSNIISVEFKSNYYVNYLCGFSSDAFRICSALSLDENIAKQYLDEAFEIAVDDIEKLIQLDNNKLAILLACWKASQKIGKKNIE